MHETPEPAPAIRSLVAQNGAVHVAHILARTLGAPIPIARDMAKARDALNDDPEMNAARRPCCPARALARDRRRIAVHEAGHYAIARHLGLRHVFAVIWQGEAANPARDVWRGLCGQPRVGHHGRHVEDGMMLEQFRRISVHLQCSRCLFLRASSPVQMNSSGQDLL